MGDAGELFAINYEGARLISAGLDNLAGRIEHTAKVKGDHEGYDILSFEENGAERLIEVKTTKYSVETPFFVSRNEARTSEIQASQYHVYRLFGFKATPRMYMLHGAFSETCRLSVATYLARPK